MLFGEPFTSIPIIRSFPSSSRLIYWVQCFGHMIATPPFPRRALKFVTFSLMSLDLYWSPYSKLQINQIEKVQRTAARWTCRRWRNTSSVGEMLDELEWPSLEARRDQSSLLLFHKIHSGAVSIEKDKYLTPARSLKSTRSSHSAQYCRYQTYSDALKNSFFPRTIPQWNSLSPSAVNSQTAEEFRALLI